MTALLHHIPGAVGQVLAAVLLLIPAWCLRSRSSIGPTVIETLVRSFAIVYAVFEVGSWFRLFTPAAILVFGLLASAGAWTLGSGGARADPRSSVGNLVPLPRSKVILLAVPGVLVPLSFLRVMAAPPLAWDDLTYHLVKSAQFVQSGGFIRTTGPDAWGSYAFYPYGGEAIWSFFMLFARSDVLIPAVSIVVTVLASGSVAVLAREFGADRESAFLAGAFVLATPSVLSLAGTAYVDNLLLGCWMSAVAFAIRHARTGDLQDGITAATAGALAAATKLTGGAVAALTFLFLATSSLRRHGASGTRRVLVYLGLLVLGCCTYLRTWMETGSPLYPVPLKIAGTTLFEGNALWTTTHGLSNPDATLASRFVSLLLGTVEGAYLGPGVGALFLPLLLPPALVLIWRRGRPERRGLALATVSVGWLLWTFLDPMHRALLDVWAPVSGRLLSPLVAVLAAVAACAPQSRPLLLALTLVQLAQNWWRPAGIEILPIAGALAIAVGAAAAIVLVQRLRGPSLRTGLAGIAILAVATAALATWRDGFRHAYYRQARVAPAALSLPHALDRRYVAAEAWQSLDRDHSLTIAYAAGFDGIGHNWYRYPLFGSRLQNRVAWISPGTDAVDAFSYVDPEPVAWSSWVSRLVREDVDVVVLTEPRPPEALAIERRCPAALRRAGVASIARVDELVSCSPDTAMSDGR